MNPPPTPTPVPLPLRLFRSLVILSLTLAWMVIAALFYASRVFSIVETYFNDAEKPPGAVLLILGVIVLLVPLALASWAARRQWLKWPVLAFGWLAAGAILAWLAWDDPLVRRPLTIDEVAPAFDGAERSYAVIMEYGKQHPGEESKAFTNYRPKVQFSGANIAEPEKWVEFLTKNRAARNARGSTASRPSTALET